MHEEWTDKLSEYLDDELPAGERAALERHLAGCASCTAVLNDLKTVVARAASLAWRVVCAKRFHGQTARQSSQP